MVIIAFRDLLLIVLIAHQNHLEHHDIVIFQVVLGLWIFARGFKSHNNKIWGEKKTFSVFLLVHVWVGLSWAQHNCYWMNLTREHSLTPPPPHTRLAGGWGGRVEGQACADPWARTPISASGILIIYLSPYSQMYVLTKSCFIYNSCSELCIYL
jgi:hypothetical protein